MINVITWLWGSKFTGEHVARLRNAVRRHLRQAHTFICMCDRRPTIAHIEHAPIPDLALTKIKGCFARLRMFDPEWQAWLGCTDRLVCVDLDTVITGPLDHLFDRPEPFVIMQGGNAANPCPYNGALIMLRPGAHPEVWSDFTLQRAQAAPFYAWPDDQAWLHHKAPGAAGWRCGADHGVYVFGKPGWPKGDQLPPGARLVTFIGDRSPEKFMHLPWVQEHWR